MKFFDEKSLADLHNINVNAELEQERIKKIIDERIQIMYQQFLFSYDIFKDAIKEYPSACCKAGIRPCVRIDYTGLFKKRVSVYKLQAYVLVSEHGKLYEYRSYRNKESCFPVNEKLLRSLFFEECDGYIKGSRRDLWKNKGVVQEPHLVSWVGRVAGNCVKRDLLPVYDFECYEKSKIESNIQELFMGFLRDIISKP